MIRGKLDQADPIALFGAAQPVPERRTLSAGRLEAVWDAGALRNIRYDGIEVLRGIAFLSRDDAWRNNSAEIDILDLREEDASFHISFDLAITNGVQRLKAAAQIDGRADGSLHCSVSATAETDFSTNRTGFTVLHPLKHVVGQPVDVIHTDGTRSRKRFPEMISPAQPIFDIRSLTHEVGPGLKATVLMEGAKFEMEDHRNWMDASYKTYSGSLLDPWPYVIGQGECVTQSVTLTVAGRSTTRGGSASGTAVPVVLGEPAEALPEFGTALSLTRPSGALEGLNLLLDAAPAFLVGRVDGRQSELDLQATDLAEIGRATKTPLQIELILPALRSAHRELKDFAMALDRAGVVPQSVVVTQAHDMVSFQPGDPRPPGPSHSEMAAAAREAFPDVPIGGGVVAFFTELNRLPVPKDLFDFVTHAVCPTVHAADDVSLMENLEAAEWIFASARNMIGSTPYHLGPSWISSRVNPYGPSVDSNEENQRLCLAQTDPRQRGLFGAAWLLGLAAVSAEAGLDSVGLASLAGPQGLICGPRDRKPPGHPKAEVTPAYHVLKGLAAHRSCRRLVTACGDPGTVAALGIETSAGCELWLANLTARRQRVQIEGWQGTAELHLIDEASFAPALKADFLTSPGIRLERTTNLSMGPYASARLAPAAA